MNINLRNNWSKASCSTVFLFSIHCIAVTARPASAQVQNYLNLAPGDTALFVGGSGTKVGNAIFGTTWDNSTMLPPVAMINATSQSPLHKRVRLLQRIDPNGFGPATAYATPVSSTGSTQGSFKILALQRTPTGLPRPTGKMRLLIDLNATATGYAKLNNLDPNATSYYPPNIPLGSTYTHSLAAWIGTPPIGATVYPSATRRQLATIDWDTATLAEGETDIYAVEISTMSLGASTTAQFTNINGYPTANVSAVPSIDNRSVHISSSTIENSYRRTLESTHPIGKYRNNQLPWAIIPLPLGAAGLLNERNADGSFIVDCAAKWDGASEQWMGQGTFQANTPYFLGTPNYKWTWLGGSPTTGTIQDELNSNKASINVNPFTGLAYDLNAIMLGGNIDGVGMTPQSTLKLEATDTDGAVGENTYTINWHRPYEKSLDLADGPRKRQVYWVADDPMPQPGAAAVVWVPAQEFDFEAKIDDVLVLAETLGLPVEPFSETIALFKAITAITAWKESMPAVELKADHLFNNSEAFRITLIDRPENISDMDYEKWIEWKEIMNDLDDPRHSMESFFTLYNGYASRVRYHHLERKLADKYDVNGFHSSNHILSYDVSETHAFEVLFTLKGTTPTPPTLGDFMIPPSYSAS